MGGLEEARAKWMSHSLSVLQMNAPRKASRIAKVQSPTQPFCSPLFLLHCASIWATIRQSSAFLSTILIIHIRTVPRGQFIYEVLGTPLVSESASVKQGKYMTAVMVDGMN